jgi:integrase
MKAISENLSERGKRGMKYCRRRIPTALLEAYPRQKTHITVSLGTSDLGQAKGLLKAENIRIDAEFARVAADLKKKRSDRSVKRLDRLTEEQLKALADYWVRQVLLTDERRRMGGIDDDDFDELGSQLEQQRAELGRMLATGRSERILPAMHGFIHLCGLDVEMAPEESKRAGGVFLDAVVTALDHQLLRQAGKLVKTDAVAPSVPAPKQFADAVAQKKKGASWEAVFVDWRDYVKDRPKSTAISTQTPWRDLQRVAASNSVTCPGDVTSDHVTQFVDEMSARGLAVVTINDRLSKVKAVFSHAKRKKTLTHNPALETVGRKLNSFAKRQVRRLPFDEADIKAIFSSAVFNEQQLRSKGQAREASYWIPLIMYYSGARTEEIAGLSLADVVQDPELGWYFSIIDRPSPDDDLFDDEEGTPSGTEPKQKDGSVSAEQWRTLKNGASIRKVPVAQQLFDMGLLRYMDWVRDQGGKSLFPDLEHDWHNKLSGAFSKFFGRYKKLVLGIENPKKVLYSFRHTMKDLMTRARVESKLKKRILGHASGEGAITDGYGEEDEPLEAIVEEFRKIRFFPIAAKPWQPGKGYVRYPKPEKEEI